MLCVTETEEDEIAFARLIIVYTQYDIYVSLHFVLIVLLIFIQNLNQKMPLTIQICITIYFIDRL